MPLYEYECAKHGRFERIRKFSDPPLTACPTCGDPVNKLPSSPAIQFKGSGWYVTDYARKGGEGSSKEGAAKEGAAKEGGGKDAGKEAGKEAASSSAKDSSSAAASTSTSKDGSTSGSTPAK